MIDDVTVLVPLHRSAPEFGCVDENLRRLAPHVRIVVSDATGEDDTLERLRSLWADHPNVSFVGSRPLEPGWVAHYVDLLDRCATPWFMWLPHDDEIDVDYVERCLDAAESESGAIGAFGRIHSIVGEGLDDIRHPVCPDRVIGGSTEAAVEIVRRWNLGVAFRGVFRKDLVGPIRSTTVDDEWADLVWVFGLLVHGRLVSEPTAVYRKRHHRGTTHAAWRIDRYVQTLVPFLIDELADVEVVERRRAVAGLAEWSGDDAVGRLEVARTETDAQRSRSESLEIELRHAHESIGLLRGEVERVNVILGDLGDDRDDARAAIAVILASRTWRIGARITSLGRLPSRILRSMKRLVRRP